MAKTKHTPGPWHIGKATEFGTFHPSSIKTETDESVAMVYGIPGNCTLEELIKDECAARYEVPFANARLIAAAPELLEALRNCVDGLDSQPGYCSTRALAYARQVIAKAEGK